MRNPYSRPLYDLYIKARDFRAGFEKTAEYLIKSRSGLAPIQGLHLKDTFVPTPYEEIMRKNVRTFATDKELAEAYSNLRNFRDAWRKNVGEIIDKLPQISFRMRFDDPEDNKNAIRMGYYGYDFTPDMDLFLDLYDKFDDEVDELFKIINDYEKSIYQSSDFTPEPKPEKEEVVYRLVYDEISGKLLINNHEIYKCNLDRTLDKALLGAFRADNHTVTIKGNLASTISKIRAPKGLRSIMFSTGKGVFRINPEITTDDLKKAGLDKEAVEKEFQTINND